jgi:hypothetical protein
MERKEYIIGLSALGLNLLYLLWLYANIDHALGSILFIIDCGFTFMIILYLFNHRRQKMVASSENPACGSLDTLRLFFRKNSIFQNGLTFRQKLHYFETGLAYLFTAVFIPILLLLLPLSIFMEIDMMKTYQLYLWIKIPAMCLTFFFFWQQSNFRLSEMQMGIALFPAYLKALLLVFKPGKPKYIVTEKGRVNHRYFSIYIIPHLAFLGINLSALYWHVFYLEYYFNLVTYFAIGWTGLIVFWFWPVLKKGFGIIKKESWLKERESQPHQEDHKVQKLALNPQYSE